MGYTGVFFLSSKFYMCFEALGIKIQHFRKDSLEIWFFFQVAFAENLCDFFHRQQYLLHDRMRCAYYMHAKKRQEV